MKKEDTFSGSITKEELKIQNDLLKAKITSEFGMKEMSSELSDEEEYQWLKQLYSYEKSFAESKPVMIYDFIGKPEFRTCDKLCRDEITTELKRLSDILGDNNIVLDLICEYDDEVIYRFITEELFQTMTDDMKIEGMTQHYIYEEFHPNHGYDIRNSSENFFKAIFERDWDGFEQYLLYDQIELNGKSHTESEFVNILLTFQKTNKPFKNYSLTIAKLEFSLEFGCGNVSGKISYESERVHQGNSHEFSLQFILNDYGILVINKVTGIAFTEASEFS